MAFEREDLPNVEMLLVYLLISTTVKPETSQGKTKTEGKDSYLILNATLILKKRRQKERIHS